MLAQGKSAIPAFLIADAAAVRKYGLGMVRPGGWGTKAAVADGYLIAGDTIEQLAQRLNIDPGNLHETVDRMNGFAQTGRDLDFDRGSTVYQNHNGDVSAGGANPNLGPIATAPFYALRLYPSDIGTSAGLVTDDVAPRAGFRQPADRWPLCVRQRHAVDHGRNLPRTGDHARAGDCVCLPRGFGRNAAILTRAFSSEVDTGSRQENASKQKTRARF